MCLYPPGGVCECSHLEYVHAFGKRGGVTVRTYCDAADPVRCPCRRLQLVAVSR